MLVEIHGAGFKNKGALKMLDVALNELRARIPEIQFVADGSHGTSDQRLARRIGTFPLRRFWMSKPPVLYKAMTRVQAYCPSQTGCASSSVNAFIDISGFAFSSQWGDHPARNIEFYTKRLKKLGKPIIFMPQAFGPFNSQPIQSAMRGIIDNADLIFARDQQSFANLSALSPGAPSLRLAPDITLFSHAEWVPLKDRQNRLLIVPNVRVLDQGRGVWSEERYISVLAEAARTAREAGLDVAIVVHDTEGHDRRIADQLRNNDQAHAIAVFEAEDPWELKSIISRSKLLIGSRFHALAAALSVGVPAIAIGWSHKYGELLRSFNMIEYDLAQPPEAEAFSGMLKGVLEESVYSELLARISAGLDAMKVSNIEMWEEVTTLLQTGNAK